MPVSSVQPVNNAPAGWVALGVVTQPHGVSGRVKVKPFTETPEQFIRYKNLTDASGQPIKFRVTGEAQGQYILEIDGITSRDAADRLRGMQLGLPREALPPTRSAAEFYAVDLIGLCVETVDGKAFGIVADVQNYGASDIIEITRTAGHTEMFAFTQATFPSVDLTARRLVIQPPELLGSKDEEEGNAGA